MQASIALHRSQAAIPSCLRGVVAQRQPPEDLGLAPGHSVVQKTGLLEEFVAWEAIAKESSVEMFKSKAIPWSSHIAR
jgi:hypothetical protein